MNHVPDRKKLRREYLKRKRSKYMDAAITIALMLLGVIPALLYVWFGRDDVLPAARWGRALLPSICLGIAAWVAVLRVRRAQTEVQHIPYVPPVTAETLPAEEILVRGSEEPPAVQSEVLLRAAQAISETPKEELLRMTNNHTS